ncbi:MAG: hypothetical protein AB1698_10490, partial [Pseudomonadota bacterium]
ASNPHPLGDPSNAPLTAINTMIYIGNIEILTAKSAIYLGNVGYNELLDLLKIDKTELKKLDTAGKQDFLADKAARFSASWPFLTYEEALAIMGPVRDPGENRPV